MWLIERDSTGLGPSRIALPGPLRKALVRWYAGDGTRHDELAGIALVQNARIGHKWLACDCLGRDVAPPILTPAYLSEAETYYLRRLTQRPEHRHDCTFFRDQATNRTSEVRSQSTPNEPPSGFFSVLKPAPENLSQRPDTDATDDRTRNASTPRLARLLWRLIDISGVNVIAPLSAREDWSIRARFEAIGRASAKIEIAPHIELARALWTHAGPLQRNAVFAALRALAPSWPSGHEPQGFVLLYSTGFKGREIYVPSGEPVVVANRVQSPSIRGNHVEGPFLTLIVVGKYPEAKGYSALRAYAQPVNGRLLVPVDSDLERTALRRILEAQRLLHGRAIDLAVRKPVFDTITPEGPCRPDFVLEARSRETGEIKTRVIEVMGLGDDAYLEAKRVTHPRMRALGAMLELSPKDLALSDGHLKVIEALEL